MAKGSQEKPHRMEQPGNSHQFALHLSTNTIYLKFQRILGLILSTFVIFIPWCALRSIAFGRELICNCVRCRYRRKIQLNKIIIIHSLRFRRDRSYLLRAFSFAWRLQFIVHHKSIELQPYWTEERKKNAKDMQRVHECKRRMTTREQSEENIVIRVECTSPNTGSREVYKIFVFARTVSLLSFAHCLVCATLLRDDFTMRFARSRLAQICAERAGWVEDEEGSPFASTLQVANGTRCRRCFFRHCYSTILVTLYTTTTRHTHLLVRFQLKRIVENVFHWIRTNWREV